MPHLSPRPSGVLRLLAVLVLLPALSAACGGAAPGGVQHPDGPAPEERPYDQGDGSGGDEGAPCTPNIDSLSPAERVRAERSRIAERAASIGIVSATPSTDAATGAEAGSGGGGDRAVAVPSPDPSDASADGEDCERVCAPARGICDSADAICHIAQADASFGQDCTWARDICHEADATCQQCES